tara:strand:- start:1396 stop:2328 length:933 start_codon:yes stop_codon:yes gene_type:complete
MKSFSKARIKDGLSNSLKTVSRDLHDTKYTRSGIGGGSILEPVPGFNEVPSEHVISNKHNAYIVLGRDRPGSRMTGYGGRGDTHCASVDIVAGRLGYLARSESEDGEKVFADPNFKVDAARIYLSQKTDVDKNFDIAKGSFPVADTKSAVAIKADGVRIMAREGIKLVTGIDGKTSQGSKVTKSAYGINLIAGNNDTDLQPIPKGDNLVEMLTKVIEHIDRVTGILDAFLMSQIKFNTSLGAHVHISPFFGIPTAPSILASGASIMSNTEKLTLVKSSLVAEKLSLINVKVNYLTPIGKNYINSFNNYSN